jgi:hypothetical protein
MCAGRKSHKVARVHPINLKTWRSNACLSVEQHSYAHASDHRWSRILARANEKHDTATPSPVSAPAKILAMTYNLCRRKRRQRVPTPYRIDLIGALQNLMQACSRWRLCPVRCIRWRIPAYRTVVSVAIGQNLAWVLVIACLVLAKISPEYIICVCSIDAYVCESGSRSALFRPLLTGLLASHAYIIGVGQNLAWVTAAGLFRFGQILARVHQMHSYDA